MNDPSNHSVSTSIVSPEDQKVTFVELFFDLVFVFSVTQVVRLLHDELSWVVVGQAILVFWLVWWGWSQFTWTLNAADTTHPRVQIGVLVATGVAFFMAVAVPEAFEERSFWFAITYIAVRAIGITLYYFVARDDPALRAALRTWIVLSTSGLLAVLIGGVVGGTTQYWLWAVAILLDVVAANASTQAEEWDIHPEHFAERHGLFVIIALGETLIVAAAGVTDLEWSGQLLAVAVLVVAITGGLWWSYFPRAMPAVERGLASKHGAERAKIARDSYSLLHFPMMVGIIAYAAAIEQAIGHPGEPLGLAGAIAFSLGMGLFVIGMGAAVWRATGRLPWPRVVISVLAGVAIIALVGFALIVMLAIALISVLAIGFWEQTAGLFETRSSR